MRRHIPIDEPFDGNLMNILKALEFQENSLSKPVLLIDLSSIDFLKPPNQHQAKMAVHNEIQINKETANDRTHS